MKAANHQRLAEIEEEVQRLKAAGQWTYSTWRQLDGEAREAAGDDEVALLPWLSHRPGGAGRLVMTDDGTLIVGAPADAPGREIRLRK